MSAMGSECVCGREREWVFHSKLPLMANRLLIARQRDRLMRMLMGMKGESLAPQIGIESSD